MEDVDPKEVFDKKDQLALIDVREPDEYTGELGHVPGARLLSLGDLGQKFNEIPQDKTVVFICRSGGRSGKAAAYAKEKGLTDCYNMDGGMLRWNDESLETER